MLAPNGGGLILYQAYGNLYAMTGRKAHLLEDKQIPSVGVFDEVSFYTLFPQAVLMTNISNYGSDVILSHEKMIDSQMDDMIKEKIALKEQVDSLEQNLSKQIKEKECLLQTFTVFKSESKEKEDKYMENEIDLEKKDRN
ncbi:hypothetical protein Tco_0168975 [Tanacetum coccineum]